MRHDEALQQVSSCVYLVPAYGRRYDTSKAMLEGWNSGKDFKIYNGPYCSIRDIKALKKEYGRIYLWSPVDQLTETLSSK